MKRWRHLDKFRTFLVDKSVIFFWYHVQIDLILLSGLWLRISLLSKRGWQPCLPTSTTWTTHSRAIDICIACNLALAKPPLALLRLSPSLSRFLSPSSLALPTTPWCPLGLPERGWALPTDPLVRSFPPMVVAKERERVRRERSRKIANGEKNSWKNQNEAKKIK